MKVSLCAIARLENNYIREWVEHYYHIGIDKIYLYDNNFDGEDDFNDVIGDYIKSGFVSLIDVRNKVGNIQMISYDNCYKKFGKECDYMCFFDIDEFLEIKSKQKIQDILSNERYRNFNCIRVSWLNYDDNGLIRVKDNNYSVKRFTHHINFDYQTKCFIKTGLNIKITSPHGAFVKTNFFGVVPENRKIKCCNSLGKKCDNEITNNKNTTHEIMYLKHYRFKTVEEYVLKIKRGYPNNWENRGKNVLNSEMFFRYNKKTKEKEEFFKIKKENNNSKITPKTDKIKQKKITKKDNNICNFLYNGQYN